MHACFLLIWVKFQTTTERPNNHGAWKKIELYTNTQKEKLDEIKKLLCIAIKNAQRKYRPNPKAIAKLIGTSQSRLSDVHRIHIDRLSIGQLFQYLIKLDSDFSVQILYQYYLSEEIQLRGIQLPPVISENSQEE